MNCFRKVIEDIYILETPSGGVWSGIVFVDGKEKVLIDSGDCSENIDSLLVPALKELGCGLSDIDWLCNTHCHGDHVGGHQRILELAGIKVATYVESVPKIKDPLKYSKQIRAVYPEHSAPAPTKLNGVEPDLILQEGDMIGGRLKVIATPGHDTDCVCFYDTGTKTLITGDSLQGNGTATQGTALYMDLAQYRATLEKLMHMDIENIISGHPYLFSGDMAIGKNASVEYLNKCLEITYIYETYIKAQLQASITHTPETADAADIAEAAKPADAASIAEAAKTADIVHIAEDLIQYMGNQRPKFLFLPLYTVDAHLQLLRSLDS